MISRERFYPLKERNESVKRKRRRRRNEDGSRALSLSLLAGTRARFARSRARRQSKTQSEREHANIHILSIFFRFSRLQKKGEKKKEIFNARALGKLEKRRSREHRNARETSRSRQCRRELSVSLFFFCRFLNRPNKRARGRRCRRSRLKRKKKRKKFGRRTGIGSANAKRRSRRSDSFVRGRHRGR